MSEYEKPHGPNLCKKHNQSFFEYCSCCALERPIPVAQGDGKTAELLPCPFCGQTDVIFEVREASWKFNEGTIRATVAVCRECAASGPAFGIMSFRNERAAKIYWNQRAPSVSPGTAANKTEAGGIPITHLIHKK